MVTFPKAPLTPTVPITPITPPKNSPMTSKLRRVAANYLIIAERQLINHVVEIYGSRVVNYYPLKGEIPMTEWLGGTIVIKEGKAYHNGSIISD